MKQFLGAVHLLLYFFSLILLIFGFLGVYTVDQWVERPVTVVRSGIVMVGFNENYPAPEIIATDMETGKEIRITDLAPGEGAFRGGGFDAKWTAVS